MSDFDRSAEDVGNIVALEHVNVTVPDQELAALFYVSGLGLTRDPYMDFGGRNMWVNAGQQQFHLPRGEAQVLRGFIDVLLPDLEALQRRLEGIAKPLSGTVFDHAGRGDAVHVTCPWGNRIRVWGPATLAPVSLGIPRLELLCPADSAAGIARFYGEVVGCPVEVAGGAARVRVGAYQTLEFRETADPLPPYDGHHIAVYLAGFSRPYRFLRERGLVTEESDQHQYRFQAIVDPASGETLLELEHEVRSLSHPLFNRHLVNRNPAIGIASYRPGREALVP